MTRKIIRLESLSLMDYTDNGPDVIQTTKLIEVGRPYDDEWRKWQWDGSYHHQIDVHGDRDVVQIEYARNAVHGNQGAYIVTLKNGNKLRLPEYAFACEDTEEDAE